MFFKVLSCLFILYVMVPAELTDFYTAGYWKEVATDKCIGAKNNHPVDIKYEGQSTFIIAMKLVYRKGKIGCASWGSSRWGCNDKYPINIIVTDTRNKRMYPSDTLVKIRAGGWYDLPGYDENSSELVLSDPGFRYLYHGQTIRIWYGEDLYNWHEGDNHGYTCMDVFVYIPGV